MTNYSRRVALLLLLIAAGTQPSAAQFACVGDCNRDCRVSIDEVMGSICNHLGLNSCRDCDGALDANCNGSVGINELVQGVGNALSGCPIECAPEMLLCPAPLATATPTITVTPTETETPVPTLAPALRDAVYDLLAGDYRCGRLYVWGSAELLRVYCTYGRGHETDLVFKRLEGATDVEDAVASFAGRADAIEFQGAVAYLWDTQFPNGSLDHNYRYLRAQLGCWLVSVESFDDTGYDLAFHPVEIADVVADAVGSELLAHCEN